MQKVLALTLFLVIGALFTSASPVPDESTEVADHIRQARFTCDVMSYGGKVKDSACALHCLMMGRKGGHCTDGVCVCRRW